MFEKFSYCKTDFKFELVSASDFSKIYNLSLKSTQAHKVKHIVTTYLKVTMLKISPVS